MNVQPEILVPEIIKPALRPVEPTLARTLAENFANIVQDAERWTAEAKAIKVTSADDKSGMKTARALRLKIREIRCQAENKRKELKEGILVQGRAIDGINNVIVGLCQPAEKHLQDQEDYAERLEAERIAKIVAERSEDLRSVGADPSLYDLGHMPDDQYAILCDSLQEAYDRRIAAEAKAKEEAAAKIVADAEERERLRAENDRLRKEQEARDAAAKKERDEANAKAETERKAREQAEAALKKKQDEERAEKDRQEKARKKAAAAPDRDKLESLANVIGSTAIPTMTSELGQEAMKTIAPAIANLAARIREAAKNL